MLGYLKRLRNRPGVDAALEGVELPSFPSVVLAALEKVRDENATTAEIADAVSADPALSVRLLGTVNSAARGLRREVRSVQHSVSLLGRREVEAMLVALAAREALPDPTVPGFRSSRFWATAARRAFTARAIADEVAPARRSECFTAALLQDMAVPLLAQVHGEAYGAVLQAWHDGEEGLEVHEARAFGWEHAAVGGRLCRTWKFPASIATAIAEHHDPGPDLDDGLIPSVVVAPLREENEAAGIDRALAAMETRLGFERERAVGLLDRSLEESEALGHLLLR